jgi:hypothetical protein
MWEAFPGLAGTTLRGSVALRHDFLENFADYPTLPKAIRFFQQELNTRYRTPYEAPNVRGSGDPSTIRRPATLGVRVFGER